MKWLRYSLLLIVTWFLTFSTNEATKCKREPPLTNVPKTSGDNGFKIVISGNPEKYVPGELYTGKSALNSLSKT